MVQVSDGSLIDSVTVNFSIGSENDAPTILDLNTTLSLSLLEDSTLSYDLNATDADGDTLSWSLSTIPNNGAATVDPVTGVLSYTPTANYNGSDSLVVQVSDGSLSDRVTINFTISEVNNAPVIIDLNTTLGLSLSEDGILSYDFNATDIDGDTLSWSITAEPQNGSASVDSGSGLFTYTPNPNFFGSDTLIIQVSDSALSDILTINLTVESQNDAPVLSASTTSISCLEDTNLTREMNASDPDGDSLVWRVVNNPIHGTVTLNSSSGFLNYLPNLNFNGQDSLTLEVSDGVLFDRQVFDITVLPVNDAPQMSVSTDTLDINTSEDANLSYFVQASDPDGDSLTWSILETSSKGNSSIDSSSGNLIYWPNPNYTGLDSLLVQVSDGVLKDNITITISISPVNDAPVIIESNSSLSFTLFEDQNFTRDINASDVDGDSLTWILETAPEYGTALLNSTTGYLTYTPNLNYVGLDSLKIVLTDGAQEDEQFFNFVIMEKNDPPFFLDSNTTLSFTVPEDLQLSRAINASDPDGDTLIWSIRQPPVQGASYIDSETGVLLYQPNPNFKGSDMLTVQVSDGALSSEITIYLSVIPANDPPNNISLSNSSVAEGLPVGYTIGLFTADDPDHNQSHTFSLVSGSLDNESFSLDSNGSLQTAEIFDFELKSIYSIRVQTTDQDGSSLEKVFSITIADNPEKTVDSVVLLSEGVTATAGWKQAGWFGYYFSQSYPWIYHSSLGWVYVSEHETTGAWLYREPLGWLWTNPSTYPYLFRNSSSSWMYLDRERGPIRYYDFSTFNWKIIE